MTDKKTPEAPAMGTCENGHEHPIEEFIIADYGKVWRVRCGTCRIIYSVNKK